MKVATLALLVAPVMVLAACGSEDGSSPAGSALPRQSRTSADGNGSSDSATKQQLAAAALPPCPALPSASPVPGGLPDLTLPCLGSGPAVNLAALRGIPTVVNVWASWCGPCRAEAPILADAATRTKNRIRFVGIDYSDDQSAALAFAAQSHLTYASIQDTAAATRAPLRVPGVPTTIFLRADGTIAGRTAAVTSSEAFAALLKQNLGVRPT
jgi:cytochrome c biogenesis protein CcmG, thiol:disulfide interchange protein DsbE